MTASAAGTVLAVDDEEMVVESLESFLQLETPHRIHTFTSASAALEALATGTEPDVVIADFLMPGMDGIDLLKKVREVRPRATRVLLTGYADKENAIRAINEVGLYHYLEKPWENAHLELIVRNGVERARLLRDLEARMADLEEKDSELSELRRRLIETFL